MGKTIEANLGEDLRKKRKKANISMSQVAYEMNISLPYLSDLERGRRALSQELVMKHTSAVAKLSKKK